MFGERSFASAPHAILLLPLLVPQNPLSASPTRVRPYNPPSPFSTLGTDAKHPSAVLARSLSYISLAPSAAFSRLFYSLQEVEGYPQVNSNSLLEHPTAFALAALSLCPFAALPSSARGWSLLQLVHHGPTPLVLLLLLPHLPQPQQQRR